MEMDLEYQTDANCKSFVDEYSNFSIVSSREKGIRAEGDRARVDATWRIDPAFENNCTYLNMRLKQLQASIRSEIDKNPSKVYIERTVNPMRDWEAQYKRLLERNNCVDIQSKREQLEFEKKIESAANRAASVNPEDIEVSGSDTNKYIIFGVGGLIAIITLAILIKK